MDDFDQFERNLAAALRSDADTSLARFEPVTVASAAMGSAPRRSVHIRRRFTFVPASTRWAIAAAAVIGVIVVGGLYYVNRPDPSAVGGPSPTASTDPSQPAVGGPSATPTAMPSPTPTPILWTEASLKEDWPAPVRTEPAGGAILVPILVKREISGGSCPRDCGVSNTPGRHIDPSGDTGSDDFPWVDIQEVGVTTHTVSFTLPNLPPDEHPTERWVAYGLVFDDDRDGVPDRRIGIDNAPRMVEGHAQGRDWITDLRTGRTVVSINDMAGEIFMDVTFPDGGGRGTDGGHFSLGGEVAGGGTMGTSLVNRPFYVWASVIQDGRVVATDYAPDAGWLDTSLVTTRVP